MLVKPRIAHAQWLFARLAPALMNRMSMRFISQRARQPQPITGSLSEPRSGDATWLR